MKREAGGRPSTALQPAMTHKEIAAELGITPTRVQQIERQALLRLRQIAERLGYTFEDVLGALSSRPSIERKEREA